MSSVSFMPIDLFSAKNLSAADKANLFTERMSSTAHQREVEDLKAAGLNPVLSADSSGATTGSAAVDDETKSYSNPLYSFITGVNKLTSSSAKTVTQATQALERTIKNLAPKKDEPKKENDNDDFEVNKPGYHSGSSHEGIKKTYGESANSTDKFHSNNGFNKNEDNKGIITKINNGSYKIGDDGKTKWDKDLQKIIPSWARAAIDSLSHDDNFDYGHLLSDYYRGTYSKIARKIIKGDITGAKKIAKNVAKEAIENSTNKGTGKSNRVVGIKGSAFNYGYNGKRNYNVRMEM